MSPNSSAGRCRAAAGFTLIEVMITCAISVIVAAIAVPMMTNGLHNFRLSGDARSITNTVSLAKLRAASDFSKSRVFVDIPTQSFHLEVWSKTTNAWVTEGGSSYLSSASESFSFGVVGTPPPNTQGAIGFTQCLTAAGVAVANTACVVFNSRGIPVIDAAGTTGAPTANQALYITDGTAVFGVTVAATGVIKLSRTQPVAVPTWVTQ
jgi:prepilin-type N-terminal cleavage/methylation domain-containing protein